MVNSYYYQRFASHFTLASIIVVIILASSGAQAQSGRRAPKSKTTVPTVSGPKTIEGLPAPVKDDRIPMAIGIEEHNPISGIPYYLAGTIRDTCAVRLRASSLVKLEIISRGMSRGEAVRRAKAEKETYVVWLQVESDSFDSRGTATGNSTPESLYIRYTVFSPVTAKIKSSGRTYQQIQRNGRGGVLGRIPSSRGSSIYSEYALKEAAREVAERILEAFKINVPDGGLPGD